MKTFFINNKSDKLIVFFCGWAMDEKPFECLSSENFDVLFVYDYSSLDLDFDFSNHKAFYLIAFSYGVFIAQLTKNLPPFIYKLAINGTLKPIDKICGINPKIFEMTLSAISEESIIKFYSKMFDNDLDYEYFLNHMPSRESASCKLELEKIKEYSLELKEAAFEYDETIISSSDKIFPAKSQINYWSFSKVTNVEAGHFLFYKYKTFDEIMSL